MARKTLEERIRDAYEDDDVAQWVAESVAKSGNEEKIMAGELVLPHPHDAKRNMERERGLKEVPQEPSEKDALLAQQTRDIAELREQVKALADAPKREKGK